MQEENYTCWHLTCISKAIKEVTKMATKPQGPHVVLVDVEANRVIMWAPFEPIFHGEGNKRRFSVSPKDKRVQELARQCREMRKSGKNVELRMVVS